MTEEQREQRNAYQRAWHTNMTEEQREQRNVCQRSWRANMTEEQRKQRNAAARDCQRSRRANMTEEQRKQRRERQNACQQSRRANMTEEQREEEKACRRRWRLKRYGTTPEQYDKKFAAQDGKCAICGKHNDECRYGLLPDHDHMTGALRGLLCNKHNSGLGQFGDTLEGLTAAIAYLIGDDPAKLDTVITYLKGRVEC